MACQPSKGSIGCESLLAAPADNGLKRPAEKGVGRPKVADSQGAEEPEDCDACAFWKTRRADRCVKCKKDFK